MKQPSYLRNIDWHEFSVMLNRQFSTWLRGGALLQFHDTLHAIHISRVSRKQISRGTRFPADREEDLRKEVEKKEAKEEEIELPWDCNGAERDYPLEYRARVRVHAAFSRQWKEKKTQNRKLHFIFTSFFLNQFVSNFCFSSSGFLFIHSIFICFTIPIIQQFAKFAFSSVSCFTEWRSVSDITVRLLRLDERDVKRRC